MRHHSHHPFLEGVATLLSLHRKSSLFLCRIHTGKKQVIQRGKVSSLFTLLLYKLSSLSSRQRLVLLTKQWIVLYFGSILTRESIQRFLSQSRERSLLQNVFYKELISLPKLKREIEREKESELSSLLSLLFEEFIQQLLPDLSSFSPDFVQNYEEVTERFTRKGSPWLQLRKKQIQLFAQKCKKKGKKRSFYESLSRKEQKWIVRCKMLAQEARELLEMLKILYENDVRDYRFDQRELAAIVEIAERHRCTHKPENDLSEMYLQHAQKKLHALWKKHYPPLSEGKFPTSRQLQEAFSLSQNHQRGLRALIWHREEFKIKQLFTFSILYGKVLPSHGTTLYPFSCPSLLNCSLPLTPIVPFSDWLVQRQIFSKKPLFSWIREQSKEFFTYFYHRTPPKEQNAIQEWMREKSDAQFERQLTSFPPSLLKEIYFWAEELYMNQNLLCEFSHCSFLIENENAPPLSFSPFDQREQLSAQDGAACLDQLEKSLGKTFCKQLLYRFPQFKKKRARDPLPSALLKEIEQEQCERFFTLLLKRFRTHLDREYPTISSEEKRKKTRERRRVLQRYCSSFLFSSEIMKFLDPDRGSLLEESTSLQQKSSLSLLNHKRMTGFFSRDGQILTLERPIFFQKKPSLRVGDFPTKEQGTQFPLAMTKEKLMIDIEQDRAEPFLYSSFFLNDEAAPLFEELLQLVEK